MDIIAVLGLNKLRLQAPIDSHGPSMYSGHHTASINSWKKKKEKKSTATTATLQSLKSLMQKPSNAYIAI